MVVCSPLLPTWILLLLSLVFACLFVKQSDFVARAGLELSSLPVPASPHWHYCHVTQCLASKCSSLCMVIMTGQSTVFQSALSFILCAVSFWGRCGTSLGGLVSKQVCQSFLRVSNSCFQVWTLFNLPHGQTGLLFCIKCFSVSLEMHVT